MIKFLKKLFKKAEPKLKENKDLIREDFRAFNIWEHKFWGNNIQWSTFEERKLYCLMSGVVPRVGDILNEQVQDEDGNNKRVFKFVVLSRESEDDPRDIYWLTVGDLEEEA